ncbi:MAG: hypothetical protein ABIR59_11750 [Gemmatimonadales bacterium]
MGILTSALAVFATATRAYRAAGGVRVRRGIPGMIGTGTAVLLAACGKPAPPPPELMLAPTADTVVVPMVGVSAAAPLSDGRWVVLAPEEGAVRVIDFTSRTAMPFAGSRATPSLGPSVLAAIGDTVFVGDWSTRRFTSWLPTGTQIDSHPAPEALAGAFPQARDAAGQWYFEIGPSQGPEGRELGDSAAVVRSDAMLTRFDTLAFLAPIDLAEVSTPGGRRMVRRALSGRDRWGVERDGTLWITRVDQNVIEWRSPGDEKLRTSARLPDPILPVQEMDRQIHINRFPEEYRATARQLPFAALKPPFEAVLPIRQGMFLIEKNGLALDSTRAFQVVDTDGVIRRVVVPSRGNALGFDGSHLLLAEQFPGGVRLLRYLVAPQAVAPRDERP